MSELTVKSLVRQFAEEYVALCKKYGLSIAPDADDVNLDVRITEFGTTACDLRSAVKEEDAEFVYL